MADNRTWYYREGDQNRGPFTLAEMGEATRLGQLSGVTYVWQVGMPTWKLAQEVGEMRGLLSAVEVATPPDFSFPNVESREHRTTGSKDENEPTRKTQAGSSEKGESKGSSLSLEEEESLEDVVQRVSKLKGGSLGPAKSRPRSGKTGQITRMKKSPGARVRAGERFTAKKNPPKFTVSEDDFSGFYELNAKDVDDRTAFVKNSTARSAKKEAHKALVLENSMQPRSSSFFKVAIALTVLGGLAGGFVVYSRGTPFVSDAVNRMTAQIKTQARSVSVNIPEQPDMSAADRQVLLDAATQGMGLAVKMIRAKSSGLRPIFYVAGNLPSQLKLEMILQSTTHPALKVMVPFFFKNGFAMTDALRAPEGGDLAYGSYLAVIAESEEQSTQAAEFLRKLPPASHPDVKFLTTPKKIIFAESIQIP